MALKAVTDGWMKRLEHDLAHDEWESRRPVRFERAFGFGLVGVGMAVLSGWALVEFSLDPEVPFGVRVGVAAVAAGGLALLFSVIRWRRATAKADPYREVIR
jgi:hypothetical protein